VKAAGAFFPYRDSPNSESISRRKKIKCDGNEPTCTQCITSKSQCTWLQTKDRAALSRQYVIIIRRSSALSLDANLPHHRYVQELETRLLHMETLFNQVTPILEQVGHSENTSASSSSSQSPALIGPSSAAVIQKVLPQMQEMRGVTPPTPPEHKRTVKFEEEPAEVVSEAFEQLALDEHGHLRWIGNSSTMSLIQSFRALTASPLHRVSPMEDNDPRSPMPTANKLYFPASVFFGQVRALPGVEDVEYPSRDLADALVSVPVDYLHHCLCRVFCDVIESDHSKSEIGSSLFLPLPLPTSRGRQTVFLEAIPCLDGQHSRPPGSGNRYSFRCVDFLFVRHRFSVP